jgi:serine/threonine-protein kinase
LDKIGKYKIQETLGQGSMGLVYRALDPDIDRTVAVKVVNFGAAGQSQDEENLRLRFLQEAKAAGRLSHPNIIAIYDTGRENNNLYIVMQYIEGKNLQQLLSAGRTFTPLETLNIIMPICRALDYAHQNGVIHRDIKPANIILDQKGHPYLTDFGVAKLAQANLTRSGLVFGTPGYISPEQFMGEKIDGRSDLFSLGVLLYVLLTGTEPFAQRGMELTTIMKKILTAAPDPPSQVRADVPRGFDVILNKALAKRPEKRYQTGQEMAMALETVFEEACSTLLVRLDDRLKPSARPRPDGRKFLTAASFITVILLTAVAAFMFLPKLFKVQATLPQPEAETAEVQNRPGQISKPNTLPEGSEQTADKAASGQAEGQTASKQLEAPESAGQAGASASSGQVAGPSQDFPAKAPQPAKPQSSSELSQAQMKEELQKQAELGKKVAAGTGLYSRGDFAGCLKVMEEVLSADEQNSEARRYRYLASTALARQDILSLLERQRLAEEEKDLPSFLQDFGPAELVRQKRDEALLLFDNYDQILSVHSNISLVWPSAGRAEVRFGRLLTAVYKKTGERKVLADSVQVWSLEKKGQEWKVTRVRGQ